MLSRIARMSSFGVQIYGGCSRHVEGPIAPNVALTAETSGAWDHQYCKFDYFPRQRNPSIGDPLLSIQQPNVSTSLDDGFLLDLDKWNIGPKQTECKAKADTHPLNTLITPKIEIEDKVESWIETFGPIDVHPNDFGKFPIDTDADQDLDVKAWDSFLNEDSSPDFSAFRLGDGTNIKQEPDEELSEYGIVPAVDVKKEQDVEYDVKPEVVRVVPPNAIFRKALYLSDLDLKPMKKRGVKMKPSEDPFTDKRREMNREAAFRYRERKRLERISLKREMKMMSVKNSRLRKRREFLEKEIAMYRRKVYGI